MSKINIDDYIEYLHFIYVKTWMLALYNIAEQKLYNTMVYYDC